MIINIDLFFLVRHVHLHMNTACSQDSNIFQESVCFVFCLWPVLFSIYIIYYTFLFTVYSVCIYVYIYRLLIYFDTLTLELSIQFLFDLLIFCLFKKKNLKC